MEPQNNVSPAPAPATASPLIGPVELFRSGWKLLTNHWKLLTPIVILPSVIGLVGTLCRFTGQPALVIVGGLISLVGVVFSLAVVPAIINAIHRFATEPTPALSLKGQYKFGFGLVLSYLWVGIINALVTIGASVFLIIPGIIVGTYVCLYIYTVVIDGKKGFSALTDSYSLVHGRWWPVFGRLFFMGLAIAIIELIFLGVSFVLALIFGVDFSAAARTGASVASSASLGFTLISSVVSIVSTAIVMPILFGFTYRLYASLKETRQANVSTVGFKKWLIAFLVIGILTPFAIIGLVGTVLLSGVMHNLPPLQNGTSTPYVQPY